MPSVTIISAGATNATTTNRMYVGGTVVAQNWENQAITFYTVAPGKRLVLKGKVDISNYNTNAGVIRIEEPSSPDQPETTIIATGNVKLSTSGVFVIGGFLEDDV